MHTPSVRAAGILCLCIFGPLPTNAALAQRAQGFDVSQFQGDITWATAYNAGVRFAFIRSCRGGPLGAQHVDLNFHANMAGSSNIVVNGEPVTILTGNYHFGRPDTLVLPPGTTTQAQVNAAITAHAQTEADFFYSNVSPYLTTAHLRPALDLEVGGVNSTQGRANLSLWANSFLDRFESLSGVEPMIYTNTNYTATYFNSTLSQRDLWVANWTMPSSSQTGNPPTGVFPTWAFWQYSSTPNAAGAQYGVSSTDIDLNVAHGDMTYVQSFLIPEPAGIGILYTVAGTLVALRRRRAV